MPKTAGCIRCEYKDTSQPAVFSHLTMDNIIYQRNILISTLISGSQGVIKVANGYVSSFSPDIFGRQKPTESDTENYFKLYRDVSAVASAFSNTAVNMIKLAEDAKRLAVTDTSDKLKHLISELHRCSLLCSVADEQCFSPYLCGIYDALGLDSEKRTDINVGVIRNLTHGFSVNLNEFIHSLEDKK